MRQDIFRLLKYSLVISLLLLYFIGSSRIESFHKLFHENESVHSAQVERDPCHIKVFHQQKDGGCDHTSHYVKEDKCALCDIQFHSNTLAEVEIIVLPFTFNTVCTPNSSAISIEGVSYQFEGRAPPVS